MAKKAIHVVTLPGGGWGPKREGASRASSAHDNKADAVDAGRRIARREHTELKIHNKDGRISDSDSYGKDPCPPKDKKH